MKSSNKLHSVAALLTAAVTIALSSPVVATASQHKEVCIAEQGEAGAETALQCFVVVDASGAVTEYVYNSRGLLVEETDPLGAVTTYAYDGEDRLAKTFAPDGTVTEYAYTAEGYVSRITAGKTGEKAEVLQYRYTPDGYLAAAISETTMDEYTYTGRGELASVTRNGRYRLELAYDTEGNLTELKESRCGRPAPDSVTNYAYDASGRMVKVTRDGMLLAEYSYDDKGRLKQQVDGMGSITEYTYGSRSKPVTMETRTAEGMVLYREENSYNENQSLTARVVTGLAPEAGGADGTFSYTYDENDRLIKEQGSYGTITYTYDVMGNRLTKTENGVTTYYIYDLCNKLLSETTNGETTTYLYDSVGNLVEKKGADGITSYTYNAFQLLETVTNPQGVCQKNFYDALGIRSGLVENDTGTQYMTYNGIVLAAYDAAGERTEHYSYGKKLLTRQ